MGNDRRNCGKMEDTGTALKKTRMMVLDAFKGHLAD
jgi:hypothetical protein